MILDDIVVSRRIDLASTMQKVPLDRMMTMSRRAPAPLSLSSAIKGKRIDLIAEVKKASPSRGVICENFDPVRLASVYASNGAAAISVLTEPKYFLGSITDLQAIRINMGKRHLPLLRKDFIFDVYQVYEARAYGADSLLLIAAILDDGLLAELLALAKLLGMDCLVETHDEADLEKALACGARIIGINNRDLHTFKVDISVTRQLRKRIPADRLVVSESGIKTAQDIAFMRDLGINAVLVGEALVSASDPAMKIRELIA